MAPRKQKRAWNSLAGALSTKAKEVMDADADHFPPEVSTVVLDLLKDLPKQAKIRLDAEHQLTSDILPVAHKIPAQDATSAKATPTNKSDLKAPAMKKAAPIQAPITKKETPIPVPVAKKEKPIKLPITQPPTNPAKNRSIFEVLLDSKAEKVAKKEPKYWLAAVSKAVGKRRKKAMASSLTEQDKAAWFGAESKLKVALDNVVNGKVGGNTAKKLIQVESALKSFAKECPNAFPEL